MKNIFKSDNRWICAYCIFESLHSHGVTDKSHMKKEEEFIGFIKMKSS